MEGKKVTVKKHKHTHNTYCNALLLVKLNNEKNNQDK